jgi:hypothetical protein
MKKQILIIIIIIFSISFSAFSQTWKKEGYGDFKAIRFNGNNATQINGVRSISGVPNGSILFKQGDSLGYNINLNYNSTSTLTSILNLSTDNISAWNNGQNILVTDNLQFNGNYNLWASWNYDLVNYFNPYYGWWRVSNLVTGNTETTDYIELKQDTFKIGINNINKIAINKLGLQLNSAIIQKVLSGARTTSFTYDAGSTSIGAYTLSNSGAVIISIHNLQAGMQGTIFLAVATNPSGITVNTYSDAGSTAITKVLLGSGLVNAANKSTSITYTCVNNGTNTLVYLVYGQEN